jgi:nitroreductase
MGEKGYSGTVFRNDECGLAEPGRFFLESMQARFACKLFDPGKHLSRREFDFILECGRLSPSSFGLEHWEYVVVADPSLREGLFEACLRQDCVRSAGLALAILVRRAEAYDPGSEFIAQRAGRFPGGLPVFLADYQGYYDFLSREGRLEHWARAQTYIALANMLTGAASIGVDSCAVEGFEEAAVLGLLGRDPAAWSVGVIAVFGFRAEEVRPKIREPIESVLKVAARDSNRP